MQKGGVIWTLPKRMSVFFREVFPQDGTQNWSCLAFLVVRTGLKTNGRCAFVESSQGQKVGLKGGDQSKLDTEEEKGQNRAKLFHKEQACKL